MGNGFDEPSEHVKNTCKVGQDNVTCRYLAFSGGFRCVKLDPGLKAQLDKRVAEDSIGAQGDNCPGKPFDSKL